MKSFQKASKIKVVTFSEVRILISPALKDADGRVVKIRAIGIGMTREGGLRSVRLSAQYRTSVVFPIPFLPSKMPQPG
jgi:hypothetical protein